MAAYRKSRSVQRNRPGGDWRVIALEEAVADIAPQPAMPTFKRDTTAPLDAR